MLNEKSAPMPALVTEMRVGNTTFIVASSFSDSSRETAATKMAKVLKNKMRLQPKSAINFSALK